MLRYCSQNKANEKGNIVLYFVRLVFLPLLTLDVVFDLGINKLSSVI